MLKNLMEEKQLDFNAPLLSVRRFSSTLASSEGEDKKKIENSMSNIPSIPYYRPELKSGPVRNPGVVPFIWEQIPGKPKDGGRLQRQPLEQPHVPPKLPPGRNLDFKQQCADKGSEDSIVVSALNDNVTKLESSKEDVKEKVNSDSEEDTDDAYSDALDSLSRTESFFLNCSVSGISGLDGLGMKPSGAFVTDPQTRDFMMGRFLPAAIAMASETPQYSSRKQPVVREQPPRQVRKIVGSDSRRPPLYQCKPSIVQNHVQDKVEEQSEDEDDDDYDGSGNSKACGLFPRLCLRNSFFLLNPVPGIKVRAPVPASSVRKVRAQVKTEIDEVILQQTWDSVYKDKLVRELEPLELQEDESKMMTSESNQLTCWSDYQTPDRSLPYRHLGGVGGISPYRNEAQQSPFHEGTGFLGIPKEGINLKDKENSESGSPVVEKTLYVDFVNVVKTRSLELSSSDTKGLIESADGGFEILGKTRGLEETSPAESAVEDINHIDISEGRSTLHPKILETVDPNQDSKSVVCSEMPADSNLFDQQEPVEVNRQGNSFVSSLQSPLPPPLPKSPSESWLLRTLPSISSRNPSSRAYPGTKFHTRKQAPKTSPIDPKWENIVRTRTGHHYH